MYQYNMIQWLSFFFIYCFFGWIFESVYVSGKSGRWVNRGFLNGPFLPLYGSGSIMLLLLSNGYKSNIFFIYMLGVLGGTVIEYITGTVMEALFKVRYWDYSNRRYNFQGRICLTASATWGFLAILMVQVIHPSVEKIILSFPATLLTVCVLLITVWVSGDFALSFREAFELRDVLTKIDEAKEELANLQRRMDVVIAVVDDEIKNRKKTLVYTLEERKRYFESIISMKRSSVDMMKQRIEEGLERISLGSDEDLELAEWLKSEFSEIRSKLKENLFATRQIQEYKTLGRLKIFRSNPSFTSEKFRDVIEELKNRFNE